MEKRRLLTVPLMLLAILLIIGGGLSLRAFLGQRNAATLSASLYLTGTKVIPTVRVSISTARCDPQHVPGVSSDPAGGTGSSAIKPHLCSIPTFTAQDARNYMATISSFTSFRIRQVSAHFTVTRILFVTDQVANDILNADTGVISDTLIVCYVEVYGDFTVEAPFAPKNSKTPLLHHGQMVFDGVTGNMLVIGVMP
jgi:hypothetical protein